MEFDVVVETPKGHRNKYELDHKTGRIRLDRTLFTATAYPTDYGFIEGALGLDGDPLDAIVLVDEPTFPGCLIRCRPIGMFSDGRRTRPGRQGAVRPGCDTRQEHLRDIIQVSEYDKLEIQHFFQVYKEFEPGKRVEGGMSWVGRADAEVEIEESRGRLA